MAFEPNKWSNGESGGTPVTASELNRIEQAGADIETIEGPEGPEGPRGPTGDDGERGEQGERGPAGADGSDAENPFTEDEVSALKAMVADGD